MKFDYVPGLNEGVRPDVTTGLATFGVLRSGQTFHIAPSAPKRASWASSPRQAARAADIAADPRIVTRVSHEDEIIQAIESAMAGGPPVSGFVGFTPTLTGIKVIPHRGKPFVAKNARELARMIDRDLLAADPLEWLGLNKAPTKPAPAPKVREKRKWVKVTLADLRSAV